MPEFQQLYWCEDPMHSDWKEWDEFLQATPRGHYLQLSDWLKGYAAYGFSSALLVGRNQDGKICAGLGIVKAGFSFIKLYIAPVGPIISEGWEEQAEALIQRFHDYCQQQNATYAHVNIPVLVQGEMPHSLPQNTLQPNSIFFTGREGIRFKNVATISGFRWVDLQGYSPESAEKLLESFPSKVRRDIRSSCRKGLECVVTQDFTVIRDTYDVFEKNAEENNYQIRPWNDIEPLMRSTTHKGTTTFVIAMKDGVCKGAIWLLKCGNRFTYMMGGTTKETPDLLAGYFLQWNALLLSLQHGFCGYDISVGGSAGVLQFKAGFNSIHLPFITPRFWIFSPLKFNLFELVYRKIARHKRTISSFLKMLTGK